MKAHLGRLSGGGAASVKDRPGVDAHLGGGGGGGRHITEGPGVNMSKIHVITIARSILQRITRLAER